MSEKGKYAEVYKVAKAVINAKELYTCARNVDAGLADNKVQAHFDILLDELRKQLDHIRTRVRNG